MKVRIAAGNELPKGWHPGTPLTVGRNTHPYPTSGSGCPFGPQCYSCRNGQAWNADRGKHTGTRTLARDTIARRALRLKPRRPHR